MKLDIDDGRMIDLGGIDPSKIKAYGVGSVAVMQTIVRQSMYSDPISAVVKEYCSNGVDAHRERHRTDPTFNQDTPLRIEFSHDRMIIGDSGLGISKYRMENNFASYFSSTKRDNNDDIGGFGLGCKTAFADPNRDCFTVETVYREDEVTYFYRTYHYINANGLTAYAELTHQEVQSDRPTGTKIILPIDESDMSLYTDAIRRICKHWAARPVVSGVEFAHDTSEPHMVGSNWHYTASANRIDVVLDSIPYVVDQSLLPKSVTERRPGLTLFFQTGEIAVTSTRESLDYRGDTINRIIEAVRTALSEIRERLSASLDQMNLFDAREAVATFGSPDGYEWLASGVYFAKSVLVFTRAGSLVTANRTDYVGVTRKSVLMTCGYRSSTAIAKGRALTYLLANPHIETLFVTQEKHEDLEAFTAFLKEKGVGRLSEMVAEQCNFRKYPVHQHYKPVSIRRKCHKFLLEYSNGRWQKLDAGTTLPLTASYCVIPTGVSARDFRYNAYQTSAQPDFAVHAANRLKLPVEWVNVKHEIKALLTLMRDGELSVRDAATAIRVNSLSDLCYDEGRIHEKTLARREQLPAIIKEILKFGDTQHEGHSYNILHTTKTDLDHLGIDKEEILCKVLCSYKFPKGSLRTLLASLRKAARDNQKSQIMNIKGRYKRLLENAQKAL